MIEPKEKHISRVLNSIFCFICRFDNSLSCLWHIFPMNIITFFNSYWVLKQNPKKSLGSSRSENFFSFLSFHSLFLGDITENGSEDFDRLHRKAWLSNFQLNFSLKSSQVDGRGLMWGLWVKAAEMGRLMTTNWTRQQFLFTGGEWQRRSPSFYQLLKADGPPTKENTIKILYAQGSTCV